MKLPAHDAEHAIDSAIRPLFHRDGHVLVRGLATREEVQAYRPVIASVMDEVARKHDAQGRIDDYSSSPR